MNITLFSPPDAARQVTINGFTGTSTMSSESQESIAELLGCSPRLVDVLASSSDFVAYSVFDFEGGQPNEAGMRELTRLTDLEFGKDDDTTLFGPILIAVIAGSGS